MSRGNWPKHPETGLDAPVRRLRDLRATTDLGPVEPLFPSLALMRPEAVARCLAQEPRPVRGLNLRLQRSGSKRRCREGFRRAHGIRRATRSSVGAAARVSAGAADPHAPCAARVIAGRYR